MMNNLFDELRKFNEERDWNQFHTPENMAKSISIEASELLECFQWTSEYDKEKVCEELADVINNCIVLSQVLNVNIENICLEKLKKNKQKYPVEKCKGKTDKYTNYQ